MPRGRIELPQMIGQTPAAVLRTQTESCHGQAETKLQTGISPTHSARKATWPAALGGARACPGRGATPASRHLNEPARTRRNRPEDDEARREPDRRGPHQSHQPGTAAAVPPREYGN